MVPPPVVPNADGTNAAVQAALAAAQRNAAEVLITNGNVSREYQAEIALAMLREPSSNAGGYSVSRAIRRGYNRVSQRHGGNAPDNTDVRNHLGMLTFREERQFSIDMMIHSDETTIEILECVADEMSLVNTSTRADLNAACQEGIRQGISFLLQTNSLNPTPAQLREVQVAIRNRLAPIMLDPRPIPNGVKLFTRQIQNLPNNVFWQIVADACRYRITNGSAFCFYEYFQDTLNGLNEMSDVKNNDAANWNLKTAHRGFVHALYVRFGPTNATL